MAGYMYHSRKTAVSQLTVIYNFWLITIKIIWMKKIKWFCVQVIELVVQNFLKNQSFKFVFKILQFLCCASISLEDGCIFQPNRHWGRYCPTHYGNCDADWIVFHINDSDYVIVWIFFSYQHWGWHFSNCVAYPVWIIFHINNCISGM